MIRPGTDGPSGWKVATRVKPLSSDILAERTVLEKGRMAIATFGLRIGVVIEPSELRDEALLRLPPVWEPTGWNDLDREVRIERAPDDDAHYSIFVDDEEIVGSVRDSAALDRFENAIQYYVAEFADPWLFVHAGVVAWQGTVIVLPGRSFSGKSTLVHALVDAGATYLSDEYAVFDAEGRVWPYRRRLSLREGPFGPARRVNRATDPVEVPLAVGIIALLKYDAEVGWEVEPVTPAQAVMGLCDNTVAIQRRPKDALEFLVRVANSAQSVKGTRGEAREAALALLHVQSARGHDGI